MVDGTKQLARARQAARKRGLPADLYIGQWGCTLIDFDYKCAYCGRPYETIDHVQPMSQGGGTTVDNCLPSCQLCNARKANVSFDRCFLSAEVKQRVKHYLNWRRTGTQRRTHTMEETASYTRQLADGSELLLYRGSDQIALHLRTSSKDPTPFTSQARICTVLTPFECLSLAQELLQVALPSFQPEQTTELAWFPASNE